MQLNKIVICEKNMRYEKAVLILNTVKTLLESAVYECDIIVAVLQYSHRVQGYLDFHLVRRKTDRKTDRKTEINWNTVFLAQNRLLQRHVSAFAVSVSVQ